MDLFDYMRETTKIKSNAIGIPLLAVIQGIVAVIGYFILRGKTEKDLF